MICGTHADINRYQSLHVIVRGAVQGVGFRPFIYRLATEMGLRGCVVNSVQGVVIEVEGKKDELNAFLLRIEKEKPPLSFIQSFEHSFLDPVGYKRFEIRQSDTNGSTTTLVLPDSATCPDCLREIFDPANRRYLYPFTNCTNCGPRFSIIEALPYDRINTTMKQFNMCGRCLLEYENPLDRRFHAQPNACSECGPHLELWDSDGKVLTSHHDALAKAADAVRVGYIVAVKGIGGFHLMVDARNEEAVVRLRQQKHRDEKPFALMFPSLDSVQLECEISELEERVLLSSESPIVLVQRKSQILNFKSNIAPSVSPNNPFLGVMLPYSPLHHILMKELGFPVVATSGNFSDEPICADEFEALKRLHGIADLFLVHNRSIKRHIDDSVVRMMMGRELVLRRARGYAPLPIQIGMVRVADPVRGKELSLLSVGAHLKNTVAFSSDNNIFISQHLGDLETQGAFDAFQVALNDFQNMYRVKPHTIVCDMHQNYFSTRYAKTLGVRVVEVQHHYAHVASCMAENHLEGRVLGVSWDGTGFGPDGTIWGGEFLLTDETSFQRVATLRQFRLPGGEQAVKEPRRTALGLLFEIFGEEIFDLNNLPTTTSFSTQELTMLRQMLSKNINSPLTSSAGRLFDAVASIIGIRQRMSFEGQAAMELEFLTAGHTTDDDYPFSFLNTSNKKSQPPISQDMPQMIIDWEPMVRGIIDDVRASITASVISTKFHNTLSNIILQIAKRIGEKRIVLTGGCFQNKYLTERTIRNLEAEGFRPYWHQRVPPNDGGISLGQIYATMRCGNLQADLLHQSSFQLEEEG